MRLDKLLNEFYTQNGLPVNTEAKNTTFEFKVFWFKLNLPNPKFRRYALYIHDIEHVLHNKDTSWEGEGFIAGWEISTGMCKHFQLGFMSLWAMGYSLWIYPKSVFKGFKKGLNNIGIIDLNISKPDLMKMDYSDLVKITQKESGVSMEFTKWIKFLFGVLTSQFVFLFPLLIIGAGVIYLSS